MIDIGFNKFLTLKLVKVLWVLCIVLAALFLIGGEIYGFRGTPPELTFNEAGEPVEGVREPVWLYVFLTPVVVAVWLLFVRVTLELVAVIFKISETATTIARSTANPPRVDVS